jgi:hypothetical protein
MTALNAGDRVRFIGAGHRNGHEGMVVEVGDTFARVTADHDGKYRSIRLADLVLVSHPTPEEAGDGGLRGFLLRNVGLDPHQVEEVTRAVLAWITLQVEG